MDTRRFDTWARALAGGLPRRGALTVIAGLVVSGAAMPPSRRNAAAACINRGQYCDPNTEQCCSPLACIEHECTDCMTKGQKGCKKQDCCRGLKCDGGECVKDADAKCEGKRCRKKKHNDTGACSVNSANC